MTIAYRCAGNTQSNATLVTSAGVNKPTSPSAVVNGDLMQCVVTIRSTTITMTPPAGWVQVGTYQNSTSGSIRSALFWKIAASEAASWTWVFSSAVEFNAEVHVVSGADPVTPIASSSFLGSGVTSPITTTAVTTTTNSQWVTYFVACKDNTTHTWTDSATERDEGVGGDGSTYFLSCCSADTNGNPGIGSQTGTFTHSTGSPQGVNVIASVLNVAPPVPIAYRNGSSQLNVVSTTATITVNKPAGVDDGDFLICGLSMLSTIRTFTAPAGWTDCGSGLQVSTTGNVRTQFFYKIASSEPASWAWTMGGTVSAIAVCGAYTGVNQTNPIAGTGAANFDTTPTTFPLTFAGPNLSVGRWAVFVGADSDLVTHTYTDNKTERLDVVDGPSSSNFLGTSLADSNASVGVSGGLDSATIIFTPSGGAGNGANVLGVLLNPASTTVSSSDTGTGVESNSIAGTLSSSDTGTGTDAPAPSVQLTSADTGHGTEAQSILGTLSSSDTGTGVDSQTILGQLSSTDTGTGTEAQSLLGQVSSSDTGSALEGTPRVNLSSSDSGTALDAQSIQGLISSSDSATAIEFNSLVGFLNSFDSGLFTESHVAQTPAPTIGDLGNTLVLGPATIYIGDYGSPEPSDSLVGSPPSALYWTDLGGTTDGLDISIVQDFKTVEVKQIPGTVLTRLVRRDITAKSSIAEPTLFNFLYVLNGGTLASGTGYTSYSPPITASRAVQLTYRTVIIDGWAPGFKPNNQHKRRRVILRKCLSVEHMDFTYSADNMTTLPVTWSVHNIDSTTASFKVIDER